MSEKRVLITGATGFVGGFIVDKLLSEGYKVFIAARKSSSFAYIDTSKVEIVFPDLNNIAAIAEVLAIHKINVVVNNSGLTRHKDESQLELVNAQYPYNLAQAILSSKIEIKKVIHVSSLAAFGPADFAAQGMVSNATLPHPVTAYGRSKLAGEKRLEAFQNLPIITLRPTAVYGPREKDLLEVFKLINRGLEINIGNKPQTLTFIYVKDLANIIFRAIESDIDKGSYFVSDGESHSNLEFNNHIKKALNKKTIAIHLPHSIVKPMSIVSEYFGKLTGNYPVFNRDKFNEISANSWLVDSSNLFKDFSYSIQYNLESGIYETANWYKKENWL